MTSHEEAQPVVATDEGVRKAQAELAVLAEASLDCTSRERFRDLVLRRLRELIPFDAGLFVSSRSTPELPSHIGWDPVVLARLGQKHRYWEDLARLAEAARAGGGAIRDQSALKRSERASFAFYRDLAKPQALSAFLFGCVGMRGVPTAILALGRRGLSATFRESERGALATLLPVISLGDSAHGRTRTPRGKRTWPEGSPEARFLAACSELTAREREILGYVALGMKNEQIADACGSSANTVRNQVRSIFQKVGLSTRTELAYAALVTGFVR